MQESFVVANSDFLPDALTRSGISIRSPPFLLSLLYALKFESESASSNTVQIHRENQIPLVARPAKETAKLAYL